MAADMSGSQLKVLLHVIRETVGWRKGHQYKPISVARIQDVMGLSKESVTDALGWLLGRRLILRKKLRNESGQAAVSTYRLRFETDRDEEDPESENPTLEICAKVGKTDGKSDLGGDPSFSVFKEKKEKNINTLPSFHKEPQSQDLSEPSTPENLKTLVCGLVRRLRGVRSISKGIRDHVEIRMEGLSGGWSESQVEAAFEKWSAGEVGMVGWDAKRKINSFFAFLRSVSPEDYPYLPSEASQAASPTPSRYSGAGNPAMGLETQIMDFPARWNLLVPEASTDPALLPLCPKAYRDPVFAERFDEICAKASALIRDGADLKFGFLLKESGGRFRWQELLADELAWMKPKPTGKSNTGPDPAKAMIEDLLRKRKAKGYEAGTP
jgi:phage replication O-like protein O